LRSLSKWWKAYLHETALSYEEVIKQQLLKILRKVLTPAANRMGIEGTSRYRNCASNEVIVAKRARFAQYNRFGNGGRKWSKKAPWAWKPHGA
jgi:hypothetical protein